MDTSKMDRLLQGLRRSCETRDRDLRDSMSLSRLDVSIIRRMYSGIKGSNPIMSVPLEASGLGERVMHCMWVTFGISTRGYIKVAHNGK